MCLQTFSQPSRYAMLEMEGEETVVPGEGESQGP